jgi:hypothetical protein
MEKRIHLISGPRNISTALMYSFGNRTDFSVVDEPMYAHYLLHNPIEHPGQEETLKSLPHSMEEIKKQLIFKPLSANQPYYFIKNMAHHFEGVKDIRFLLALDNLFLIRDPYQLIASFAQVIPNPTMLDIGLKKEWELFEYLQDHGKTPFVLDSNSVLADPENKLKQLCTALDIPFSEQMLKWEAGPRKEDGVWAKYWYANVHKSTGFAKQKTSSRVLEKRLYPLYEEAKIYYDKLAAFK